MSVYIILLKLKLIKVFLCTNLLQYAIFLALLLLMEIAVGVLGFVFKDWVRFNKNILINSIQGGPSIFPYNNI